MQLDLGEPVDIAGDSLRVSLLPRLWGSLMVSLWGSLRGSLGVSLKEDRR